ADLVRFRELRAKNFISQAEFDRRESALATAESAYQAARAQARQAANQERYAVLLTDSGGVVTAVQAEAGQVVAAGQPVLSVARPGEKEVAFAVPEAQRRLLEAADRLEVSLNALPGRRWKATLRELSPAADPVTRTFAGRATILDPGEEVALGMSARIKASVDGPRARIELPLSALYARGAAPQVFLVDAQGTVRLQTVKTGGVSAQRVIIEAGLAQGDVVVVAGASLLRPGQRVRVLETSDRAQ
ncbi:MAG: efflux RND transporter periplasmic adaptor subunit, partial [Burkholderiales bacterium]